jgi:hypothetical protein
VTNISTKTPLAEINVKSGLKHRMRIINMGCFECPFHLQVEGHRLSVVAVDGFPVKPVTVDTIILLPGIDNEKISTETNKIRIMKIVSQKLFVFCLILLQIFGMWDTLIYFLILLIFSIQVKKLFCVVLCNSLIIKFVKNKMGD